MLAAFMEGKDAYTNEYSMNADVFSFVCRSLFLEVMFFSILQKSRAETRWLLQSCTSLSGA